MSSTITRAQIYEEVYKCGRDRLGEYDGPVVVLEPIRAVISCTRLSRQRCHDNSLRPIRGKESSLSSFFLSLGIGAGIDIRGLGQKQPPSEQRMDLRLRVYGMRYSRLLSSLHESSLRRVFSAFILSSAPHSLVSSHSHSFRHLKGAL